MNFTMQSYIVNGKSAEEIYSSAETEIQEAFVQSLRIALNKTFFENIRVTTEYPNIMEPDYESFCVVVETPDVRYETSGFDSFLGVDSWGEKKAYFATGNVNISIVAKDSDTRDRLANEIIKVGIFDSDFVKDLYQRGVTLLASDVTKVNMTEENPQDSNEKNYTSKISLSFFCEVLNTLGALDYMSSYLLIPYITTDPQPSW